MLQGDEGSVKEKLLFVPIGDSCCPHPRGVCVAARRLRDRLLKELDEQENCFHVGSVRPLFKGMLYEQRSDWLRPGYTTGVCVISIKNANTNLKPRRARMEDKKAQ